MNVLELGDALAAVFTKCPAPRDWALPILLAAREYQFDVPRDLAMFLAQVGVESAELTRVTENLNYSGERLMVVWPKRFPTRAVADEYAHQPVKLANYVYANRLGNGAPETGDGHRYRGRGLLQITGKANYGVAEKALGIPLLGQPELMERKEVAARSAGNFWGVHQLSGGQDLLTVTRVVNGGEHGIVDRQRYLNAFHTHWGLS